MQAEQAKKERSVVKNALKKARKSFRTACVICDGVPRLL